MLDGVNPKKFFPAILLFFCTSFQNVFATVQFGDTGEEVAEVQRCLIAQSLLTGEADGICGQATVDAIKTFQAAVGLTPDGICGEETFKILRAAAYGEIDINDYMASGNSSTTSANLLKLGDSGEKVFELQNLLINLGCLNGTADGIYGSATVEAVKKFQVAHGLTADGICGEQTFDLMSQVAEVEFESQTSSPTDSVLKIGDSGDEVKNIQQALINLGYLNGTADGIFGEGTESALKNFQSAQGLNPDGICGVQTKNLLHGISSGSVKNSATSNNLNISGVLKFGDSGNSVKELQDMLIGLGYMTEPADGVFGSGTEVALKNFQMSQGLNPDGVCGEETFKLLNNPKATTSPNIPTTGEYAEIGSVIKPGMQGPGVEDVQNKLSELGFYNGAVDGICGEGTVNAIRRFQQSRGMTADGICGLLTYAAMEETLYNTGENYNSAEEDFPKYRRKMIVEATAYSPQDPGLGKYTARGNLVGYGIIAVDPRVIPLGTRVYIPNYGIAVADDTGGAIVGKRIDIAFDTHREAMSFGRQTIEIYILDD